MRKIAVYFIFSILFGFFSCESNTYDEIAPKIDPKVDLVTYTSEIKSIIDANCIVCHYQNSPVAPFSLTDYQSVRNTTEVGQLIYRIETATGSQAMPLNGQKLSASQIALIKLWASQGYKN